MDEQAHDVAKRLGFEERSREEYGTSIMIVGSWMNMDVVRNSVERYWWPRILSNQLSVELWNDYCPQASPEPKVRQDLLPYIDCYELIDLNIPESGPHEEKRSFNRIDGRQPGTVAFKGLDDDPDRDEYSDDNDDLENSVALIRSGPRMVVQYMNVGNTSVPRFVGTFVSHPDSEEAAIGRALE